MPLAVRRVGGVSGPSQTYTLGPREAFRLDAVSFTVDWANEGSYIIPTLTVKSSGGAAIAEIAAPALAFTAPGLGGFSYTGPAAFTDDFQVLPPDGYVGYVLHDFGAVTTGPSLDAAWTQPPGLNGLVNISWLHSAGAVTMGPSLGEATAENTDTVTVALTGGIAAGHYLMLHMTFIDSSELLPDLKPKPVVTDSVGGNLLDYSGHATFAFACRGVQRPDGLWLNTGVVFYRIVNALSAGDTVTLTRTYGDAIWFSLRGHDITGLTVGNPIGPNPGGNYIGLSSQGATSPQSLPGPGPPAPKWLGGEIINSAYVIAVGGTIDVMLARGGVELQTSGNATLAGLSEYLQAPLPELHLGARDTLTISSEDTLARRDGDRLSNFLVYGVDE